MCLGDGLVDLPRSRDVIGHVIIRSNVDCRWSVDNFFLTGMIIEIFRYKGPMSSQVCIFLV